MYKGRERKAARLPSFDYRTPGGYFITICTSERQLLFEDERIRHIIEWSWRCTVGPWNGAHPFDFVVMPNHVHGIVWLDGNGASSEERAFSVDCPNQLDEIHTPERIVDPGSLSAVVRGFKSLATRRINNLRHSRGTEVWQDRFHDRIIRDHGALIRIREYIRDNPLNWLLDPNHPNNI